MASIFDNLFKQVKSLPQQIAAVPQLVQQQFRTPTPLPPISKTPSSFMPREAGASASLTPKTQVQTQARVDSIVRNVKQSDLYKLGKGFLADAPMTYPTGTTESYGESLAFAPTPLIFGAKGIRLAKTVSKAPKLAKVVEETSKGSKVLKDIEQGFKEGRVIREVAEKTSKPGQRTQFIDKLTPIFDLTKKAGKGIPAEKDPYKQLRNYAGISKKVESYLNENLAPILKTQKDNLTDLSKLLTLERNQELIGRGLKSRYATPEVKEAIQTLSDKYGEGFKALQDSAQAVRDYNSKLLVMLKDSGIIDEKSYQAIVKSNQQYVPFQVVDHIADNVQKGKFSRTSFNVASQDVLKGIKGSDYQIADPLESIVQKTAKIISLVDRNNALKSLVDLPKINPALKDVIQPITGKAPKGMDVISLFENGKNVDYAVNPQVASAIKGLSAEETGFLGKVFNWQANLLRAGATSLNIGFIPWNIIRDVQDAVYGTLTEKGAIAAAQLVASYPQALASAVGKDKLYQEWLQSGGAQATLTSQIFGSGVPKTVAGLAGKKDIFNKKNLNPKNLLKPIEWAGRVGEETTRLASFKSGLSRGESPTEAAFRSRDVTVDFAKSGTTTQALNRAIPFLNAGVQGSERWLRLMKNNPKAAIATAGILAGTPTVMLFAHNSQFQDHQDIPQYVKDANWIFIERDRTEEEKAAGDPIHGKMIPKAFLSQPISNLTEAFLRHLSQKDPQSLGQILQSSSQGLFPIPFGQQALSSVFPPGLRALAQGASNYDFFRQAPIVPQGLQNVAPQEQYNEKTPEILKQIGGKTGLSPLQLESGIQTMTGGLGRQLTGIAQGVTEAVTGDLAKAAGSFKGATVDEITRRFSGIRGGEQLNRLYDEAGKVKQESATESLKRKREAEKLYSQLSGLPPDMANARAKEIRQSDPLLYEKLKDIVNEQKKGQDAKDKIMVSYPVQDGTRAKAIAKELNKLKTDDEKNLYVDQLKRKKIITPEVFKQLKEMRISGELK